MLPEVLHLVVEPHVLGPPVVDAHHGDHPGPLVHQRTFVGIGQGGAQDGTCPEADTLSPPDGELVIVMITHVTAIGETAT